MSWNAPAWFPSWIPAWFTASRRRLWLLLMLTFAAVLFLIALAGAAFAQTLCGDRQEIAARLQAGFGERLAVTALTDGGALLEVLAAPSGSWTLLLTNPGGPACVVASGQNWRALPLGRDAES
ncbi:MAG: hypothetical protein WEA84_14350 [Rhodovibrionaceae bacterium]